VTPEEQIVGAVEWLGCYDSGWQKVMTRESFAHPAKFSRGLIERIFDHCLANGYLQRGDVVGDCFGGIGTGGITAAYRGLAWVGCELEEKFVKMARANFALHAEHWKQLGSPAPEIVQGDSRKFHEVIQCAGVVTSPPFVDSLAIVSKNGVRPPHDTAKTLEHGYGQSSGLIGSLKSGDVAAVITSPPFTQGYAGGGGINKNGYQARPDIAPDYLGSRTYQGTGADRAEGNIETLPCGQVSAVVTSPPYCDIAAGAGGLNTKPAKHHGQQSGRNPASASQAGNWSKELLRYGEADGQISRLKGGSVNGVVTSPPWEKNAEGGRKAHKFGSPEKLLKSSRGHGASDAAVLAQAARDELKTYGESPGQIGQESKETYWQAMAQVYASAFLAIKPGGVIAVVVKDYVKGGKRVPLCDDTARLLEHCGFRLIERVHAMLTQDATHNDLFAGTTTITKSRKSFFRRLAEKKGSPPIDFEEVLFCHRPL
jgi:DNA modification methylase